MRLVVVTGRTREEGERVVEELRDEGHTASYVAANLRKVADIERLTTKVVTTYGRIDVLVNNAGVQTGTSVTEATLDDWERVLETDFRAFWLTSLEAVQHMPAGSSILNVSSNHAFLTMPGLFPYNAVKAGIDGMTRAMALDSDQRSASTRSILDGWLSSVRSVIWTQNTDHTSKASSRAPRNAGRYRWRRHLPRELGCGVHHGLEHCGRRRALCCDAGRHSARLCGCDGRDESIGDWRLLVGLHTSQKN